MNLIFVKLILIVARLSLIVSIRWYQVSTNTSFLHAANYVYTIVFVIMCRLGAVAANRWLLTNERNESLTILCMFVCTRTRTGISGRVRFSYFKKVGKKI